MSGRLLPAVVLLLALAPPATAACLATRHTSVLLAWDAPALAPGDTITGYAPKQQMDSDAFPAFPPLAADRLSFPVAGLPARHTYTYRIKDRGTLADGSQAESAYDASQPCVTVEAPPAVFQATGVPSGRVLLTWRGFDTARRVVLERKRATTFYFVLAEVLSNAYDDRGLPPGTRYCYRAKYAGDTLYAPDVCAVVP